MITIESLDAIFENILKELTLRKQERIKQINSQKTCQHMLCRDCSVVC